MKKVIIHKRDDRAAPVLVSMIKALFPECEVEVFSEGKAAMGDSFPMQRLLKEAKEEGGR